MLDDENDDDLFLNDIGSLSEIYEQKPRFGKPSDKYKKRVKHDFAPTNDKKPRSVNRSSGRAQARTNDKGDSESANFAENSNMNIFEEDIRLVSRERGRDSDIFDEFELNANPSESSHTRNSRPEVVADLAHSTDASDAPWRKKRVESERKPECNAEFFIGGGKDDNISKWSYRDPRVKGRTLTEDVEPQVANLTGNTLNENYLNSFSRLKKPITLKLSSHSKLRAAAHTRDDKQDATNENEVDEDIIILEDTLNSLDQLTRVKNSDTSEKATKKQTSKPPDQSVNQFSFSEMQVFGSGTQVKPTKQIPVLSQNTSKAASKSTSASVLTQPAALGFAPPTPAMPMMNAVSFSNPEYSNFINSYSVRV